MSAFDQLGQIRLLWPDMLWLLVPLPLLLAAYLWLISRQRRAHAQLPGLWKPAPSSRLRRMVPPALFLLALFALVAAVSRPQAVVALPSLQRDVILALDISGSMRATDVKPNRLSAAQEAARTFIERQPRHSRVGIVAVAGTASVVQSPTNNREDLLQALERVQLQRGTALGTGIYISLAALLPDAGINLEQLVHGRPPDHWSRFAGPKPKPPVPPGSNRSVAIVLLSDGENNHGPDPLEAAKLAADHGVRIYTVGIGSAEGITLGFSGWSMRVRLDETTLRKVAGTTHGDYYLASSSQELNNIYEHLSTRMVVERSRMVEVTAFFVAVGALLLIASSLCSLLWFNRVL